MTTDSPPDAAQVAAAFGLGRPTGPMTPVARGAMGMVWRLTTETGDWAAKALFDWAGNERVEIEARISAAAIAAGIRAPQVVRCAGGGAIEPIDGQRWRMFSWMELGPDVRPPLSQAHATALGTVLARLHRLGLAADRSEIIPWFTGRRQGATWRGLAGRVREAAAPWSPLLDEALPDLIELSETADPAAHTGPCVLSHCDLNFGNVWMDGQGAILIDWEHAGAIPPLWELGAVLQVWALADGHVDQATARAIVAAYREAGGDPGPLTVEIFAGAISAWLNWTMGRVYAGVTALDPAERERAASEAQALLTHPITRRRLEALVDVAVA